MNSEHTITQGKREVVNLKSFSIITLKLVITIKT